MYTCRSVTKVVSSFGTLTLCLHDDKLDSESEGVTLSSPPYYFFSFPKGKPCNGIKASLLLYTFDLCLTQITRPMNIKIKRGDKYEVLTISP